MTHPNQPLENHMVIGPYYDETRPVWAQEPDTCAVCKAEEYDMRDTFMGMLCSSCTRKCAICDDWLLTDATVRDAQGNEAHKECAEDAEVITISPLQVVLLGEMDGAA